MFDSMIGLENLCRLEFVHITVDIKAMDSADLPRLEQVTHLKLARFYMKDGFDAESLCRIFSRLFPKLEKLSLMVKSVKEGAAVWQIYQQFFVHMKRCEFSVAPLEKERDIDLEGEYILE